MNEKTIGKLKRKNRKNANKYVKKRNTKSGSSGPAQERRWGFMWIGRCSMLKIASKNLEKKL